MTDLSFYTNLLSLSDIAAVIYVKLFMSAVISYQQTVLGTTLIGIGSVIIAAGEA